MSYGQTKEWFGANEEQAGPAVSKTIRPSIALVTRNLPEVRELFLTTYQKPEYIQSRARRTLYRPSMPPDCPKKFRSRDLTVPVRRHPKDRGTEPHKHITLKTLPEDTRTHVS